LGNRARCRCTGCSGIGRRQGLPGCIGVGPAQFDEAMSDVADEGIVAELDDSSAETHRQTRIPNTRKYEVARYSFCDARLLLCGIEHRGTHDDSWGKAAQNVPKALSYKSFPSYLHAPRSTVRPQGFYMSTSIGSTAMRSTSMSSTSLACAATRLLLPVASLCFVQPCVAASISERSTVQASRNADVSILTSASPVGEVAVTKSEKRSPKGSALLHPIEEAAIGQAIDEVTGLPSYLVQLRASARKTTPSVASELIDRVLDETIGESRVRHRYKYAVIGFAASMTAAEADRLRQHEMVARVEPDFTNAITGTMGDAPSDPNIPNPWGLRRISQPEGLAPAFEPCGVNGSGVTMVIIDSGINPDHSEFAGRVQQYLGFSPESIASGGIDITGHGTHVAGCAAGATAGVAPGANIVSLGITDNSGNSQDSAWMSALDWVRANVQPPAVVNISSGGEFSGSNQDMKEEALASVMLAGIPVIVAAGNDSWPASWKYPAASAFTLTVGATDVNDHPSVFSNFGPGVSLWAPGFNILSADWLRPNGGLRMLSGTSMASPIAAGVAALYLQRHPPTTEELNNLSYLGQLISSRTYLALLSSAAHGELSDHTDPARVAPGGNGALGGAANRLLQACERVAPIQCADETPWMGEAKSIILGDGITPIDASFSCRRNVRHTSGPITVTVNAASVGFWINGQTEPSPKARIRIIDAATEQPLWDSLESPLPALSDFMKKRTVRSSSVAGVYIDWDPIATSGDVGFGYAMTATIGGGTSCTGDLDGSGSVDSEDLSRLLAGWGACPVAPTPCIADLNDDSVVDAADLGFMLDAWGPCTATAAPGFVLDCNGMAVLRSYYGDPFADYGETTPDGVPARRPMRPDPINAPDHVYTVKLDCESLGWDSEEGNNVPVSRYDPRPCTVSFFDTGVCGQAALSPSLAAFMWGRGIDCDEVPGLAPFSTSQSCEQGELGTGLPVEIFQPDNPYDDENIVVRQVVPEGVTSISRLRLWAMVFNRAAANSITSAQGWRPIPPKARRVPPIDISVRITIQFRDGGEPLVVDRLVGLQPHPHWQGVPDNSRLITIESVLPPGTRQVRSVAVQPRPEGIDCLSTTRSFDWFGRRIASNDHGLSAEFSPDAGRTWLPMVIGGPEGAPFQASMCIRP